ncbi:hypothetical protein AB0O64_15935 [Streptomyces sp. NPDC088341]|uniref:hypothetical protein n=1 Tax=Streptomyces sp. NPDC088341 TaxID=3154870 RepID=UPI0034446F8F
MADATRTRHTGGHGSDGAERTSGNGHDGGLRMHTLHADLPIPYLTAGDITANARAAGAKLSPPMPPPKRLAFYGGLGALAILGAVDWPVAVAIGAAAVVARGGRRGEGDGQGHTGNGAEEPRKGAATSTAARRSEGGAGGAAKKGTAKA